MFGILLTLLAIPLAFVIFAAVFVGLHVYREAKKTKEMAERLNVIFEENDEPEWTVSS